jgi:hypothetical protein
LNQRLVRLGHVPLILNTGDGGFIASISASYLREAG